MVLGISKGWIHVIYYSNVERLEHLAAPSEAHSDPMDSSHPFRLSLYLVHQGTVGQWGGRHVYWGSCVGWGLGCYPAARSIARILVGSFQAASLDKGQAQSLRALQGRGIRALGGPWRVEMVLHLLWLPKPFFALPWGTSVTSTFNDLYI